MLSLTETVGIIHFYLLGR